MRRLRRVLEVSIVLAMGVAIPAEAQSGRGNIEREPLRIGVHLYNDVRVPDEQVSAAEQVAAGVLQQARIELEWSRCTVTRGISGSVSSPCDASFHPTDLLLYFAGPLEAHFNWVDQNALGYSIIPDAHEPATMAYISYPRIQKLSASTSAGVADLLGLAVAHEIGHLLFGSRDHANQGIMRAPWKLRDLEASAWEEFQFSRDQAQRLRSAIQARLRADELGIKSKVSSTMPFELVSGFLVVVNGQIGNLGGLKFIVDTGATYTMVDRKIAEKLSLQRQSGSVINFDRYERVEWSEIAELQLGPLKAQNLHVMVADLKQFSEFADGVDAIIGLDLLSMCKRFRIDYVARVVLLQVGSSAAQSDLRQEEPKRFVVPVLVQGMPVRLVVDTGMEGILVYEDRVRKKVPGLRLLDEINGVRLGRLQMKRAKLPGVYLGSEEKAPEVYLMPGPGKDIFPDIDGYLGTASLNAWQIEFDFQGNKLRWQ